MYENEVITLLGTEQPEPEVKEEPTGAETLETTDQEAGAEPAEGAEEPTGEEDTPAAPKKENKVQKRIDELTREKYEAQRERDYYKGLAEGRGKAEDDPTPEHVTLPGLRPKPTVDQFDEYEQYIEAVADWTADKKLLEREQRQQQTQAAETQKTALEKHKEREKAITTIHDDYHDVVAGIDDIRYPNATVDSIIDSDHSAELIYYLGKNRVEAERLASLPIAKQLIEVGKIEAKLEKKPEPPPKRVTQAPAPITPITAKQSLAPDPANMSDDEWLEHERERLRKKGRLY